MSDPKVLGPIMLEAKVHFIHPETGNVATANYGFPPGQPITEESIEKAMRACEKAIAEHGYVLMGPSTFFNHVIIKEKTGRVGNFAIPREFHYDAFGLETAESERPDFDDEDEDEDF